MKKILKSLSVTLAVIAMVAIARVTYADPPQPPAGGHGQGGNQQPVGAPIDGGLGILLAMGGAYGARKLYKVRKEKW